MIKTKTMCAGEFNLRQMNDTKMSKNFVIDIILENSMQNRVQHSVFFAYTFRNMAVFLSKIVPQKLVFLTFHTS